jgi:hypothetical protein
MLTRLAIVAMALNVAGMIWWMLLAAGFIR